VDILITLVLIRLFTFSVENLARHDLDSVDESFFINAVVNPLLDNAIDSKHVVKAG
jgi:hypothetical protein